MDEYYGPQTFNHFAKEKPTTTNQTYGFFYRDLLKEYAENEAAIQEKCQKYMSIKPEPKVVDPKPLIHKKVGYYIAPPIKEHREECAVANGTNEYPDNRLVKVKGMQMWHAHTGAIVNLKPV
ncbi:unnamed protein product [Calicophoron daubneyi]|uniref:Uncharacterized protein n=1 Tax=Calicophoron daubneyi TaxID=300641 RepID=A0AAV2TXW0_CALDB